MSEARRLAGMTRAEVAAVADTATVVLPLGATEQHGDHLPLATDVLLCDHIAAGAARRAAELGAGPLLLAPALAYGRSDHHLPWPGTLSLRSDTLLAVLRDLLASLAATGLRRAFAVNSHGGNDAPLRIALADAAREQGIVAGGSSYWTPAWEALDAAGAAAVGPVPGHAGGFETSLLLAIAPAAVREPSGAGPAPRAAAEDPARRIVFAAPGEAGEGVSDDSRHASADTGARMLEIIEAAVARELVSFRGRAG